MAFDELEELLNARLPKPLWVSEKVRVPYGATVAAIDANDALGDKFTISKSVDGLPLPVRGRILKITRGDPDDDILADTIHIFTGDFVAAASDAAFTISAVDEHNHLNSLVFPAGTDVGAAKTAVITDVNEDYYSPTQQLVCQLSSTGTPNIDGASAMPWVQFFILDLTG